MKSARTKKKKVNEEVKKQPRSELGRFMTPFAEHRVNKGEGDGGLLNKGEKPRKRL